MSRGPGPSPRTPPGAEPPPSRGLGAAELRELASRHGVRPSSVRGQNFLVDPNLARAIVSLAGVAAGERVVEVGAGLGSLTLALAARGAEVLAVEVDRAVVQALEEVVSDQDLVRVLHGDALRLSWPEALGEGPWRMVSNLPYNVAVPVVMRMLEQAPQIRDYVMMVQREVGERLVAGPGDEQYGAVSVRVAYQAEARLLRRVPPTVFWPQPVVESVIVRITPRPPPVAVPRAEVFRVVEAGFAQRRKTMRNALVRMGLEPGDAAAALAGCGLAPSVRAERLELREFACLAEAIAGHA